jgi:hypothetical protein
VEAWQRHFLNTAADKEARLLRIDQSLFGHGRLQYRQLIEVSCDHLSSSREGGTAQGGRRWEWLVNLGEARFAICDRLENLAQGSTCSYFLASETSILVAIRFGPSSR